MAVLGMSFTSMEGKRTGEAGGKEIKVNSAPTFTDAREAHLHGLDKKVLWIDFEFATDYEPKLATIRVRGNVMVMADDNKKALDQWAKDKTLPDDVAIPVLNHLFRRCLLKTAQIAEDLQLPLPLQMPVVKAKA